MGEGSSGNGFCPLICPKRPTVVDGDDELGAKSGKGDGVDNGRVAVEAKVEERGGGESLPIGGGGSF